jgi:thioredoxin-like negative regulator of GroEL
MRLLTSTDFKSFVEAKLAAAIHFDAEWDVAYRPITRQRMLEAEEALADQVSFGELDCGSNPELANSLHILNVPCVAYYRNGSLIAALVGAEQNIRARLERVLHGQPIGHQDGFDGPSRINAKP